MAYVAVRMQFNEEKRDVALLVEYAVQLQHTRHATNERNYHANRIHTHMYLNSVSRVAVRACMLQKPNLLRQDGGWSMQAALRAQ